MKINGKSTGFFNYAKGVQQGNPLSPRLFNLYINDLLNEMKNEDAVSLDDNYFFNALMYADDVIIFATSEQGMQKCLDKLDEFCNIWKLRINLKKTKCMTFSKGTNTKKVNFTSNSKLIENTKEYRYLGITINCKDCSFTPTLSDLSGKANRAMYALLSKMPIHLAPIKIMLKLFDICIVPILLYGSEVWAPFMNHGNNWDTSPIEQIHTQFLKRILGVNRSTTNVMVRSEMGRHSLLKHVETKSSLSLVKQAADYEIEHRKKLILQYF